jgi:uncharacterized membrane protein
MIRQFLDAWGDPAMRHAMVVHFPIVLATLGAPVLLAAALLKRWRGPLRAASVMIYALLAASAWVAQASGDRAEEAVEGSLGEAGEALLEEHETLGNWVWIFGGGVAAIAAAGFARPRAVQVAAAWAATAGGLFVAAWTANTADHGGRLVYEHGAAGAAARAIETGDDPPGDPRLAFFRGQVQPILERHCLRCHNPERRERAGDLDATTIAGLLTGGTSGPALVPGRPQESLLVRAVRWEDPDLRMPRGKDKLPDGDIALLEQWIADGAAWAPFAVEDADATRSARDR